MIEQQLADRFRAAVADEPPLSFDPDETVDRAVRGQRRRYAVIAAAASTATVALAAVAVFGVPGETNGQVAPGQTGEPSATGNPPTSLPKPGADKAIAELSKIGPKLLNDHVPGLAFDTTGTTWSPLPEGMPTGFFGSYPVSGTDNALVGFSVIHETDHLDLANDPVAGHGDLVSDTTNPDGSHTRVYRYPGDNGSALNVVHLRTNGVIAQAGTKAKAITPTGKATLPVGLDVLTALATDPRLTF